MLFSSSFFLFIFLPSILIIYYGLLRRTKLRNVFLLVASLLFYAWGEPAFVWIMIGCIGVNYIFGRLVDYYRESQIHIKYIFVGMLIFNLGILGIYKYSPFLVGSINQLFNIEFPIPQVVLPIGISFFTFQGISYVVDVYKQRGKVLKNLLDVGLYISFFPQLIAGPIVRYETIAEEIKERHENEDDFVEGIGRFVLGLSKKVLLANNFALIADKAFALPVNTIAIGFAWMGAIAYMLQIFFDFSGYSDMAIGLGKMFGFHFNENFNAPYTAKSISDFWRRWHISLGSWFRDYVYFPLGGSRVEKKSHLIRNLFVVWLLTGIWHGANWTFILWGIYFFIFILIEKYFGIERWLIKKRLVGHIYVIAIVFFGWVLFRADTVTNAVTYMQAMFGLTGNKVMGGLASLYWSENKYLFIIGILACIPLDSWSGLKKQKDKKWWKAPRILILGILGMVSVAYLVKGTYNPFIYFNF